MTADEDHPNPASDFPLWFGKQVIFLLIFLPQLESAQLKCVFDRSDSKYVDDHIPELVQITIIKTKLEVRKFQERWRCLTSIQNASS